jgi:hypothetical protein
LSKKVLSHEQCDGRDKALDCQSSLEPSNKLDSQDYPRQRVRIAMLAVRD